MKKTILIIVLAALCLNFGAKAQSKSTSTGLKIGDQVPNITIDNILNYPAKTAKISDFKGKLLIIDFWSTWCSACLNEMPWAVDLQKKYQGQVQIISVTTQQTNIVKEFLKTHPSIADLKLTMAINDNTLISLFPNKMLPHVVWINTNGKYLGATSQADLNKKIINEILKSGNADFSEYKNDNLHFDSGKPLFVEGNGESPVYEYKSLLTKYQPGLPTSSGIKKDKDFIRIHATNIPLANLIVQALGYNFYQFPENRFIIYSSAIHNLIWPEELQLKSKKFFCYELIRADTSHQKATQQMLNDLSQFFNLRISIEHRKVNCLILSLTANSEKLITKDKLAANNLYDRSTDTKFVTGQLYDFVDYLNHRKGFLPIIDETGIKDAVHLKFKSDFQSVEDLNKNLAAFGLTLKESQRCMDMIIISGPNNSTTYSEKL